MAKTEKNTGKQAGKRTQLSPEERQARKQAQEQKREQARIEYDGTHLYLISWKRNKQGEKVECKDAISGRFEDGVITMNTDKYNTTVVVPAVDGGCWVDVQTTTKETSSSYGRNDAYAELIRSQSKQNTIQALRGMTFTQAFDIAKKAKGFTEGITKTARPIVDRVKQAQAQRAQAQKKEQKAPKAKAGKKAA